MIDFYLTLDNKPIKILKLHNLILEPIFKQPVNSNIVDLSHFDLLKCIGVGGFSRVYLTRKKDTGKIYAMKLIDKEFIRKNKKENII